MSSRARACLALLALAGTVGAHTYPFPLPRPPHVRRGWDPALRPFTPPDANHPEVLRTRLVEWAVQAAGGWVRWREVDDLFLRTHRRGFDQYGNPTFHEEEHAILGPDRFYKYWKENHETFVATLEGQEFRLVQPDFTRGHPMVAQIRRSLERELFWLAHPFLFYRPGIRTRYMGSTRVRGHDVHGLLAEFDPGASPYRKVEYFFLAFGGDLVKAVATPALEGEAVETFHFTGHVRSPSGLRLPRRRELVIDGVVREVVTTREIASRAPVLPPSPLSPEARRNRLARNLE